MSDIIYKRWEKNQGYEELQADVFNKGNLFKFGPASGEQIKNEFEKENIDPNTVRYAFKGENMVGYIQAKVREKSKEVHVSYPWVLPEIPVQVQTTLLDQILNYINSKETLKDYKIRSNVYEGTNLKILEERGFKKTNTWKTLFLDQSKLIKETYNKKFTSRVGTDKDVDAIANLIQLDGRYNSQFPDIESIKNYLKEKVLKDGHLILIFAGETLRAATAPLVVKPEPDGEERVTLRFTAFKDVKNQEESAAMLIEIAKECQISGYGKDIPIFVYTDDVESPKEYRELIEKANPFNIKPFMYYYYQE